MTFTSPTDIEARFKALDKQLEKPVTAYLFGGATMAARGLKLATKDLDIIVGSRAEFTRLRAASLEHGYTINNDVSEAYKDVGGKILLDHQEGGLDIFDRRVIGKIQLTESIQSRATESFEGASLTVYELSNEDIFALKCVSPRPSKDAADLRSLAQAGIDYNTVKQELEAQRPMNTGGDEVLRLSPSRGRRHPMLILHEMCKKVNAISNTLSSWAKEQERKVYTESIIVQRLETNSASQDELADIVETECGDAVSVKDRIDALLERDVLTQEGDEYSLAEV